MLLMLLLATMVLLFLAPIAFAQNATLRGQGVDQLGAVIPNARIELIEQDGKERRAKNDTNGEFPICETHKYSMKRRDRLS
jgi:hypothetical protein